MKQSFEILSVNISKRKGEPKTPVKNARLLHNFGVEGDAHAGVPSRQVSLLGQEDIDSLIAEKIPIKFGDFAENITTIGVDYSNFKIGDHIFLGDDAIIEITQIGKKCHDRCKIFEAIGDCVMPKKGVFGKVIQGGMISIGSACHMK